MYDLSTLIQIAQQFMRVAPHRFERVHDLLIGLPFVGHAARIQPATNAEFLDRRRERLVEAGVSLDVQQLMGQSRHLILFLTLV